MKSGRQKLKKFLAFVMTAVMVLTAVPLAGGTFEARAEGDSSTEGYYTYWVENGEATITGCDNSISGDVVIPDTLGGYPVKSIGSWAFENCTGLTSITIPDSVTSIGDYAFFCCTKLTRIIISDNVTSIEDYAFDNTAYYNNNNNWENDVLYIGNHLIEAKDSISGTYEVKDGTKTIASSAFKDCTGLTSATIPDSVTGIGSRTFEKCTNLTSITIPDSVTNIGWRSFYACSKLASVTIGNSVTSIGGSAFGDCPNLTEISVDSSNSVYHSINNCIIKTISKELIIGCISSKIPSDGSVISIGDEAFSSCCTGLTSITIPDSVTSIGDSAFSGCTGLTSITIPDSVTSIGDCAFYGCTGLTSITIPNSVTSIGDSAFYDCTGLTSITIPDSITSIGDAAFSGCTGLTSITIPDSATSIGGYAFENCTGLTSITIPNSVTSIGDFAFEDCTGLTSITIPNSVTSIGYYALGYYYDYDSECFEKIDNFTIYGHTGTAAESYANKNGFTFIPLDDEHTHTFSAWTVTKEATCTAEGEETRTCSGCGAIETRKIEKKEHSLTHVEEDSTCKIQGVSYDICDMCGNTFNYSVLPLAPHTFGEWKVTKEATSFEYGERMRSCSVCGFEEKESIEKLPVSEIKDEKTGISVICPDGSYDGKVEIEVAETFDGTSYHVLNTEKGNFKKSLFDITTTIDGEKVQPNGSVFVKIPLPEGYNAEKTVVYYVTNDGKLERIPSRIENGYIIFETTHFSFYAIVDETEPENPSANCSCACHKKGIAKLFFKIKLFFQKIFKKNRVCKCGVNHY